MGFDITPYRRPADGAFYTSPARLYRTATGELCAEDDPRAAFLVVGAGGQIPVDEARAYGLIIDEQPDTKPAVRASNKARKGAEMKVGDAEPATYGVED